KDSPICSGKFHCCQVFTNHYQCHYLYFYDRYPPLEYCFGAFAWRCFYHSVFCDAYGKTSNKENVCGGRNGGYCHEPYYDNKINLLIRTNIKTEKSIKRRDF